MYQLYNLDQSLWFIAYCRRHCMYFSMYSLLTLDLLLFLRTLGKGPHKTHINPVSQLLTLLELSCCKKRQKKSSARNWFGGLGTSEGSEWYQMDPNWLIWYHSEPSGVPNSPNKFLALDFFCRFLQQDGSKDKKIMCKSQF